MASYLLGNIHSEYSKFLSLFDQFPFTDRDEMIILGNAVDGGDEGIALLLDLMMRPNVNLLLGKHEYMFFNAVRGLPLTAGIDDFMKNLSDNDKAALALWVQNGGSQTLNEYLALSEDDKEMVLDYICELPTYEEIEVKGKTYVCTNSTIAAFNKSTPLDEYLLDDFISNTAETNVPFYDGKTLVFSAAGTESQVTENGQYINLNCCRSAANLDAPLACLRLDDKKVFLVD